MRDKLFEVNIAMVIKSIRKKNSIKSGGEEKTIWKDSTIETLFSDYIDSSSNAL